MNKLKKLLMKSEYELSIFTALMMNFLLFFTKEDIMSDIIYPIHLVDLKIGIVSRTLVGTISGLLWKHPTKENIIFLQSSVVIISFFLMAVYLGRCIRQADEKSGKALFLISLITAVFPYGFMTFINLFELLDIYWVLTAVLILLASENRKASFLIPVLIFTGLWAHYSLLFAFMPLIYVLCIKKCIKEKTKSAYILTGIMIVVSVGASVYFSLTSRTIYTMSFDEFTDYIIEKAGTPITNIEGYVGKTFRSFHDVNKLYSITNLSDDAPAFMIAIFGNLAFTLRDTSLTAIICDFILISPVVLFFAFIWKNAIKSAENKKDKFLYFLCLISPLIQLFACFSSSDTSRWLSIMVISDLLLLSLFIKDRAFPVCNALNTLAEKLSKYKAALLPALLFYLTIVFVW